MSSLWSGLLLKPNYSNSPVRISFQTCLSLFPPILTSNICTDIEIGIIIICVLFVKSNTGYVTIINEALLPQFCNLHVAQRAAVIDNKT